MTISLNWLKQYIDIDLTPEQVSELLTSIGLEVESMEEKESIPGGLAGVVVGQVVECRRHPNADKLSLTKVDTGNGELLQIVCGAPNVAAGQKVLVANIGTTLRPINGEPFTLKKGNIRGEASEGMICAEDELGIGTDHSGIMVLPPDTPVGMSAGDYFNIETDYIYEIGLTPNRSDATSHLGVARDLAAALKINYGYSGHVEWPSVDAFQVGDQRLPVEVVVENTEACPRYSGVTIRGLTIRESPDWLKNRILSIGLRPINNMVDVTNFILHELGQPLHAFDLDEIAGQKIIVKTLPEGTKFQSLDEVERTLSEEDLMICDGHSSGMCIGGVFGGIRSGVKESTTNIFLESAHFNPRYIRRSSMRHNLRTDAARVFEKGSDPNVTVYALKRAALLMQELGGGEIASGIIDIYPKPIEPVRVEVSYAQVNSLIGMDIPHDKIRTILSALDMEVITDTETHFTVAVPTNKVDVTRPADVIEEILRIFGFNNVEISDQIRSAMVISPQPDPSLVRNTISDFLAASGFQEMMAVSLSESNYYKNVLPAIPENELVYINNTSNVKLDIMRPAMIFSGLEAVRHNQNRQQTDLKLFEFGRTYRKKDTGYEEVNHLTLFLTGQRHPESWLNKTNARVDYYTIKAYVQNVLRRLGVDGYQETVFHDETFSFAMRYHRGPQTLVEFGSLNRSLLKKMDLKNPVLYADFNWDQVMNALRKHKITFEEINRFPRMRRDLALIIDNSVKFEDIASIATKVDRKLLREINLFDVYRDEEQLGKDKKSYAVSFIFEGPMRTLQDKEVDEIMDRLIKSYETQLSAQLRR